ncbi:MAG TPA: hypothetical protein VIQ31_24230, partial [Phormidium sp.]
KGNVKLPFPMEQFQNDKFIHGWLMFDPMRGFLTEGNALIYLRKIRDAYVWFLNLAMMYHDARFQEHAPNLDYFMHHYFQAAKRAKWINGYKANDDFWSQVKKMDDWAAYKDLPHWFSFAFKWFVHGLNGPFGTVSKWSDPFVQIFYENDPGVAATSWTAIPPFIVPNSKCLKFCQMRGDVVNCGVCCLMFIIDLVTSQVDQPWNGPLNTRNTLPDVIRLGSTFLDKSVQDHLGTEHLKFDQDKHLRALYRLFREEIVVLMERIRFLHCETFASLSRIERIEGWGELNDKTKVLHRSLRSHITKDIPSNKGDWSRRIGNMKDNHLRQEMFDLTERPVIRNTLVFVLERMQE